MAKATKPVFATSGYPFEKRATDRPASHTNDVRLRNCMAQAPEKSTPVVSNPAGQDLLANCNTPAKIGLSPVIILI